MASTIIISEKLNHSFLDHYQIAITAGIAAIIILACLILLNTNKQRASTEVLRYFSFAEIRSATGNFSPASFIEDREFCVIYGGLIDDWRCKVVVKRLLFGYCNEVKALSKLRHDNLVSLIGYCYESGNILLVYEAGMPLGTILAGNLNSSTLSWEQRLRICIGVARGLDYLHTGTGTDHGVIHGDLKSSNILLDENYKPKISDFGLTKIDDETVLQYRQLAQKLDVFSFGIVLLELLCGRNQPELISWARSLIGDGHFDQVVDPRLQGQISNVCLKKFVAISEKCLYDDPKKRPTMVQLVARLELLLDNHVSNTTMVQGLEFVEITRGGAGPKGRETPSAHSPLLRQRNKDPMLCR